MNAAHTPGPWRIDTDANFDCGYSRSSGAIVGADGSAVVLFDPSDGEYNEALDRDSANARLIAAAPELLEALGDIEKCSNDPLAVSCARAAIDKATGGLK